MHFSKCIQYQTQSIKIWTGWLIFEDYHRFQTKTFWINIHGFVAKKSSGDLNIGAEFKKAKKFRNLLGKWNCSCANSLKKITKLHWHFWQKIKTNCTFWLPVWLPCVLGLNYSLWSVHLTVKSLRMSVQGRHNALLMLSQSWRIYASGSASDSCFIKHACTFAQNTPYFLSLIFVQICCVPHSTLHFTC